MGATTTPDALGGGKPGRSKRPRRLLRMAAAAPRRLAEPARRRRVRATPADEYLARSPEALPAAERPIERLVIQVDAPPAPPADTRTVTHLTIIAAGDLKAPGAQPNQTPSPNVPPDAARRNNQAAGGPGGGQNR